MPKYQVGYTLRNYTPENWEDARKTEVIEKKNIAAVKRYLRTLDIISSASIFDYDNEKVFYYSPRLEMRKKK